MTDEMEIKIFIIYYHFSFITDDKYSPHYKMSPCKCVSERPLNKYYKGHVFCKKSYVVYKLYHCLICVKIINAMEGYRFKGNQSIISSIKHVKRDFFLSFKHI